MWCKGVGSKAGRRWVSYIWRWEVCLALPVIPPSGCLARWGGGPPAQRFPREAKALGNHTTFFPAFAGDGGNAPALSRPLHFLCRTCLLPSLKGDHCLQGGFMSPAGRWAKASCPSSPINVTVHGNKRRRRKAMKGKKKILISYNKRKMLIKILFICWAAGLHLYSLWLAALCL